MAYDFDDISGDRIYPGAVPNGNTFSFFARFTLKSDTGGGGANRWLAVVCDATPSIYQMYMFFPFDFTNRLRGGFSTSSGATLHEVVWDTGWTTPRSAALCLTYDGSNINLYADGSSTPVATQAATATPDQGGQQMGLGCVFIDPPPTVFTAPITLYEAGWWAGTALSAANAAAITATTPNATGVPTPTNYWGLIDSAHALYGTQHGVVTGATLVAHSGNNAWVANYGKMYTIGRGVFKV